jgi:hypothetical protein
VSLKPGVLNQSIRLRVKMRHTNYSRSRTCELIELESSDAQIAKNPVIAK